VNKAILLADFKSVLELFIQSGIVKSGDYIIMDNAAVHVSKEILESILELCSKHGIFIKLLPAYSPELNPCERIFGMVKNWIRNHRSNGSFIEDLRAAFATITRDHVIKFYHHCTDPNKISSF
jgi:transposase